MIEVYRNTGKNLQVHNKSDIKSLNKFHEDSVISFPWLYFST